MNSSVLSVNRFNGLIENSQLKIIRQIGAGLGSIQNIKELYVSLKCSDVKSKILCFGV